MKILIVDDTLTNIRLLESVVSQMGLDMVIAQDGIEAVEKYQSDDPDMVIMDIQMPLLDGIEATRRIRSLPSRRWVPIILHSASETSTDIINSLGAGGDDYLVKPVKPQLLKAKISSYIRLLGLQKEQQANMLELSTWRDAAEEQNKLGQHVVSKLLETEGLRDPMLQWMNTPAATFSGDLVCASRGPDNVLYVMLADAAGHGLAAALSALPLTQVFYGMTAKGFTIPTIAEELNRKLKSFLPSERFVAASLAAIDTHNQTIEVWNGGNPDVLLLDNRGGISMRWRSRHPPLGIMPPDLFSGATESINYLHPGELVLFSDGISEAESPAGVQLTLQGLEALLGKAPRGQRLAALQDGLQRHLAGRQEHDDLSAIVVQTPTERRREIRVAQANAHITERLISNWRLELSWGSSELREMDVVPAVLSFMNQIQALKAHQGELFLILTELYNNALDHGLLGLDSRLKNTEGGFEQYLEERLRRLESLTDGHIGMAFQLHQVDRQTVLDIRLEDSGKGFDYFHFEQLTESGLELYQTHGRGIQLVKSLCANLDYSGSGNTVSARYVLL